MTLIIPFVISTALIILNIEPFKTAGILLSICYLPGLSLFTLVKRDKLSFEDLILSFPSSIGISSLLTIGLLFCGVNVKNVSLIIHLIVGIAVVIHLISKRRNKAYSFTELSKQEALFCSFAFAATLLLSIPFFLGPDRVTIASHVFHHSAMATQIINGIFPPENPGLGGTSIGYYWGFHALVAALSANINYQPIQIIFVLNALSLYMIFCMAYAFAKAFNFSERYRYIFPLAVIGLMRMDAGILSLYKLFSGTFTSIGKITAYPLHPYDILESWFSGLPWSDPRLFFIVKFYNVSGMPLAVSLSFAYLLLLLLILKIQYNENNIYLAALSIVIAASVINYPPVAIFLLIHAPLWASFIFLLTRGNLKERIREALKIALPYIIAILVASPYVLFVIKSRGVSSSGQGDIFSLAFYDQSFKNMVVFLVPLPVIISGAWAAFKRLSFSKELYFLLIGTALCLGLTIFTRLPFDNSYKFNYILTFFFAVFFVFALSVWLPLLANRWLNRLVTAGVLLFLLLTTFLIIASYIGASFYTDYRYAFSGKHFIYAQDKLKNEAYVWIREKTPKDALIMLGYMETPWPCCGINNNYEVAAITERNLYVIKDTDYTTSNPEYAKRVEFRESLFNNPDSPQVVEFFRSLDHQVYLLVEENLPDRFLVEERFKHFPEEPGGPFELKFRNEMQRVYHIRFNK